MRRELFAVAVLAGGLATRLRPLTQSIPKSMVDVAGKPFIDHQLRLLRENGASRVVICVGHLGEMIESHVGDGRDVGLTVSYSFDGDRLLGTAGAIKKALPMLGDSFFVLYGDSYLPCNYPQVQMEYARLDRPSLMTVYRNEGRWDSSNVELVDGQILAYDKKHPNPRMHHIDYGLGVFHRSAFAPVPDQESYDLATLYQELLRTHRLAAFEVSQRFYEIGSLVGLEEMRAHVSGLTLSFEHGQR